MTTFHHSLGNTRGIDSGVSGRYEEDANEITSLVGAADEIHLSFGREHRVELS